MKKGKDFTGIGVVFACHDGNGNLLFAKRSERCRDGQGTWEIPAGGVKYGERIEDGLRRELKEELGVEPKAVQFVDFKDVIEKDGEHVIKHWVTFDYLVLIDPAEVSIMEPDMCEAIEWRTPDNPPTPLHFGVRETLDVVVPRLASL